jgi:primosomal protein N' (replication factor Y)
MHVWDPVAPTLSKKAGYERLQLMVQGTARGALQQFLTKWLVDVRAIDSRAVKWVLDVDPLEI